MHAVLLDRSAVCSAFVMAWRFQVEAMVGKRKRFFAYLKKIHQEGGFWLNCVRLKRQVMHWLRRVLGECGRLMVYRSRELIFMEQVSRCSSSLDPGRHPLPRLI